MANKNVLQGEEWRTYLKDNGFESASQMDIYNCTHKHVAIYKVKDYYFSFQTFKGYKNLTSLKRLIK